MEKKKILCPECGKEIECIYLEHSYSSSRTDVLSIKDIINIEDEVELDISEGDEGDSDLNESRYICPKCFEDICDDEDEAFNILKGKNKDGSDIKS